MDTDDKQPKPDIDEPPSVVPALKSTKSAPVGNPVFDLSLTRFREFSSDMVLFVGVVEAQGSVVDFGAVSKFLPDWKDKRLKEAGDAVMAAFGLDVVFGKGMEPVGVKFDRGVL